MCLNIFNILILYIYMQNLNNIIINKTENKKMIENNPPEMQNNPMQNNPMQYNPMQNNPMQNNPIQNNTMQNNEQYKKKMKERQKKIKLDSFLKNYNNIKSLGKEKYQKKIHYSKLLIDEKKKKKKNKGFYIYKEENFKMNLLKILK